jgi:hypothetical protein
VTAVAFVVGYFAGGVVAVAVIFAGLRIAELRGEP